MDKHIINLGYKDASLSPEARTEHLISQMTLEEKVAQMMGIWNDKKTMLLDQAGNFDASIAREHFGHGNGLGQVGRPSEAGAGKNAREMAELTNAIQKFFMEESRLGIPVFFHEECLHGHAAVHGTSFSQPIGLGGTFNPDLVQKLYAMTALEARSRGAHQALTPVVDVAREPRWGRVEETFGEDPFLVSRVGMAAIKGFQGDASFKDKKNLVATLKHFAAHGQPESGTNCAPVNISERTLRETFLYPFKKAIQDAGAISIMPSYNEIDGVPSHANTWLLQEVLRGEWGFKGYAVSDYYAIRELDERPELYGHHLAEDGKEAALLAAIAGVNIELPEGDCYKHLIELVNEGSLEESTLDELVKATLFYKFKMGLFDDPYVDADLADEIVGCEAHNQLALQAARETITMLKNEDGFAPLDMNETKTIAVIGPNSDRELLGGYMGSPKHVSTVLGGIKHYVGDKVEILHHEGCRITKGGSWLEDEVVPSDPVKDRKSITEAVENARQADVVILALGGNEQTSREAWDINHMGDRTSLELVGLQNELINAIYETEKPIVAFVFNGRPLSINNLNQKASTIYECWYLGQETGQAVAEVLFGDFNPGGKLPMTVPRSVGHIPCYYNYKPSARRGYLFDDTDPLFPFGYGLSYTQFEISEPKLSRTVMTISESTKLTLEVKNIGDCYGSEVVQLYILDLKSSVTRPIKELKGFKRVFLEVGERKRVTFIIGFEELAFYDINMDYVVEPGDFKLFVGTSSVDVDLQTTVLRVEPT